MTCVILKLSPLLTNLLTGLVIAGVFATIYFYQSKKIKKKYSKSNIKIALDEKDLMMQLFDNIPDRIYFKDRDAKFILANKHVAEVMKAKDPEDLIGKTDFNFYEKKYAESYFKDDQDIMERGLPIINKEEPGLDTEGKEIMVSTTKIPIKDSKGDIVGIIGIGRDITIQHNATKELIKKSKILEEANILLEERQEEIQQMAEELNAQSENLKDLNIQLEKLSFVASNTGNVVLIMDGNGNLEWANDCFTDSHGMTLKEFIKKNGRNLRDNSFNSNISAILNQIYISKKPYTYSSSFENDKGNMVWYQSNLAPILDQNNSISNLVLIDTEISDLKNAEIQIKKQKSEIESQTEELIKTNATKDRLFSIIAHDLKNPFHSIIGFTDILQKRHKELTPEKLDEYLEMISISTNSAYDLLENLLDWARTQTDKAKHEPTILNVKSIVDNIIELLILQSKNKDITFSNEISDSIKVFADENMFKTIVRNITGNAIKYTNLNGFITFAAYASKEYATLEIADTGVGMPEEKVKSLFQLENIKSTAGTTGETGTGLGLIVCHEFVQKNNGEISLTSIPGKGTTFSIRLPLKKS